MRSRVASFARTMIAIDARSLALFRMWLAIVVLADLAIRAPDIAAFYAEDGILPRASRLEHYGRALPLSIYDLAGSEAGITAMFAGLALAAVALLAGYRTRLATALCWIGVHGHVVRAPMIYNGGDQLLLVLLTWSLFLPLNARWSVDAARADAPRPDRIASFATFAILFQVAAMFVLSGISKLGDETWRAGDGVYYALTAEFYTTELAHWIRRWPGVLVALNYGVLAFEVAGPLLLVMPGRRDRWRLIYALAIIGMNLGFWLCLNVGTFSWSAMAGGLLFIPGSTWDWLGARLTPARALAATRDRLAALARRLPRGERIRLTPRPWQRVVLGLLLALMLFGNASGAIRRVFPAELSIAARQLGLLQRGWPMFSPIARDHGWFVIPARLVDGELVDLWRDGEPVDYARPALLSADFSSYRWRKLMFVLKGRAPQLRPLFAAYLCRRWNRTHPPERAVYGLELVYMREESLPDLAVSGPERVTLLHYKCPKDSASDGRSASERAPR